MFLDTSKYRLDNRDDKFKEKFYAVNWDAFF